MNHKKELLRCLWVVSTLVLGLFRVSPGSRSGMFRSLLKLHAPVAPLGRILSCKGCTVHCVVFERA